MLPAFHGEKMQRLSGLMAEVAEREAAAWPRDERVELHPRLQELTLEVILRAVFGLDPGPPHRRHPRAAHAILTLGARPLGMLPFLQKQLGGRGPWARFLRLREETDQLLFELIAERRGKTPSATTCWRCCSPPATRTARRCPTGAPRRADDAAGRGPRDDGLGARLGLRAAGARPEVMERLVDEIDRGDGDAYLTATIQEALRRRPVLPNAAPRLVKQPITVGGWNYAPGTCLVANAYLVHHDPEIYPEPYAFRPERFLDEQPGTYTWIPFGGGRRRCLGASFALLEMKIVLRAVLVRSELHAADAGSEGSRRRAITLSPRGGAATVLRDRPVRSDAPAPVATAAA